MQRDAEKIEAALWHCDCNDRDAWITCGMAVKDELGEAGFDLWDAWSANSPKYKSRIAQVTWRSFRRSGVTIPWSDASTSILELAEAAGMEPAFSCREGICGTCRCGIAEGAVDYISDPLDPPPPGQVLICCSRPSGRIVLDL